MDSDLFGGVILPGTTTPLQGEAQPKKWVVSPTYMAPEPLSPLFPRLKPLTEEEWDRFSPKAKWDTFAAMRGPDSDARWAQNLKWMTTAVYRHKMSGVIRVGGLVNTRTAIVVVPYVGGGFKLPTDPFSMYHFLEHAEEAAAWLNIPTLHVPAKAWWEIMAGTTEWARSKEVWAALRVWLEVEENQKMFLDSPDKAALFINECKLMEGKW